MMGQRILVTPRSLTAEPHPHIESLRNSGFEIVYSSPGKTPDEEELVRLIGDVSGWLAGVEPVSPRVIEAARSLKAISRNGVGTDNLPVELLNERGIKVLIAEGANSLGVAELAIGLIFSALRSIPQADTGIKAGGWPRQRGIEIRDRTVGVIGCGAIGREVARMLVAVGARVLGFDPLKPDLGLPDDKFSFAEVDDIIAQADILTLHCPAPRDGSTLISRERLAAAKPGLILVNTARAKLVDDKAIIEALNSGQLSNYATDVFEQEPPLSLELAAHPAVIATSHIGGFTAESVDRATRIAADNLIAALKN
ncbi:phosphoglycerate dehydrogenase [Brucella rhizosphaerae]|uniref:D-isomer specific 2-hydroxyacid dehydrogenase, catalytic domain protein n=1 Tax=Brucella rhizosphaerae TaxID=571254 RepID=A0A256FMY6_9HYPH|nr:phosphoglycerate dehydrogenase [Brucella rhizosphaerae]OYR16197.1 D-isomer specific 2-hydroxyacid dehydrogenase, catalytic domain protein [Brucella rhizosphaerae]